jgi:endoglycosylceramidase
MSFHMYTATPDAEPTLVQHALDWAASTKGALLNTEWGATKDTAAITRQADELDGALIPWMYWSYDEEIVPNLHETPGGTNLTPQASAIIRPHAVVIAGTPTAMHFDAATKAFDFSWSTTRAGGGHFSGAAVTSVSLPPLVYPDGYTVTATNARVTSKPCASTLTLVAKAHAGSASVHVTPGGSCRH